MAFKGLEIPSYYLKNTKYHREYRTEIFPEVWYAFYPIVCWGFLDFLFLCKGNSIVGMRLLWGWGGWLYFWGRWRKTKSRLGHLWWAIAIRFLSPLIKIMDDQTQFINVIFDPNFTSFEQDLATMSLDKMMSITYSEDVLQKNFTVIINTLKQLHKGMVLINGNV